MPSPLQQTVWRWLAGLLLCGLLTSVQAGEAADIYYPRWSDGDESRPDYALAQLRLALDKAGSSLRLKPSPASMEQERALIDLQHGKHLDVVWSMTSREREERLLAVRIPLDKGLFGWRIALLPRERMNLFKQVNSLADLRQFSAGQGHDWPDTTILRNQGLPVVVSSSYASLFHMLQARRFDYFPRSVLEIGDELQHPRAQQLVADPHVLLHYPTALYFFFSPQRPELAETVRRGMEAAIADGSFERLFQQHFAAILQQAALAQRQVIELPNPLLPSATPLKRRELWFSPATLKR
ncbi:hypothetical protein DBR00_14850 [Pseudomonas sp. HMWF032]|uniref:substrate-binding periplasmic protein n=1 Tax=unclassified Pseudomonas TaxID=196821 RepID=UPI000D3D1716|nr:MULTISPECIES: transporter substrate-binding domain-containing protein [unclassified Pseudomonas]PTS83769.1 hypothetical protein DBR00_14850 [Pseudomonas sp. HMWF032]PTT80404.1 hypothetical protein DBR41_19915 [Pseudomonas sp. HMWF010]WAC45009.1 transporter substrate-binding domain-containing protein [Pseudomonas sp. SL4(2022)]